MMDNDTPTQSGPTSQNQPYKILDNLLEGCQVIGFNWEYIYVNAAAAKQGQLSISELLGSTVTACYPGIEETEFFRILRTCMDERNVAVMENEHTFPNGTTSWFELNFQPVSEGVFIQSQDITRRKLAEQALKQYAERMEILHRIDVGIIEAESVQTVIGSVLAEIGTLFKCHRSNISLFDLTTKEGVIFAADQNYSPELVSGSRYPLPTDYVEQFGANEVKLYDDLLATEQSQVTFANIIHQGMRSSLLARLTVRGEWIGILALHANTTSHFTPTDGEVASQIAGQLAGAIRQMELANQLSQHAKNDEEQRVLAEAMRDSLAMLTSSQDFDTVMRQILASSETVIPSEGGSIILFEGDTGRVAQLRGFGDAADDYFKGVTLPLNVGKFLRKHEPEAFYLVEDTQTEPGWVSFPFSSWIRSSLGVPIVLNGDSIGILVVDSASPNRFSQKDVQNLRTFARYAALALENADRVNQLEQRVILRTSELQAANETLKAQQLQLRYHANLQASTSDAVIVTDMKFRIQSWNQAAERIYGWTAKEAIGSSPMRILKTEMSDVVRQQTLELLYQQGWWLSEVVQRHKDSSIRNILSSVTLLRDDHGVPFGVISVNHDITERKKVEDRLLARLVEERQFQNHLKALHEITLELTQLDDLTDFFKRTVELGRERFGFERLALFLYEPTSDMALGTFGTDADGNLKDERHVRFVPDPNGIMQRAFEKAERFSYNEEAPLYNEMNRVGMGWNAAAVLWNGKRSIGWLVADNLLNQSAPSKPLLDILGLYALAVGAMLAQKESQVELRQSEARFRIVAETISDVVMRSDLTGRYTYISPSCRVVLGYEPDELVGLPALSLVHPDDIEAAVEKYGNAIQNREPMITLVVRFRHKLGHYVWLETIGKTSHSELTGEMEGIVTSSRDITTRRQAEYALRAALDKEKELGELKTRFVSMASHEFRTPLATILALTETLSAYRHKLTDSQIEERFGKIKDEVGHLKDIMEDVLLLARMQARRVEFNPVQLNLDDLCQSVLDSFRGMEGFTHQIRYQCGENIHAVRLDRKLMRQIITNLVSNAVKYSSPGSTVTIRLDLESDDVVLRVSDEGIGIPEADVKHLFEPFHRAANAALISGTGLGLVIAKESVELHGGTISLESQLGFGTTFTVRIPVRAQVASV